MRYVLAALVFLLNTDLAVADTLLLRSGDHTGFTRLTLVLPPDAEWRIDHQTRLVTLHISVGPHEFDVSQVFQRISQDRVAAISLTPGHAALLVKLNCDCAVDAFVHKKKLLVLDIKDPEPAIQAIPKKRSYQYDLIHRLLSRAIQPSSSLPREGSAALAQAVIPVKDMRRPPDGVAQASPPIDEIGSEQSELMYQISRAATQGLLEPADNLSQTIGLLSQFNTSVHLMAETAIDQATRETEVASAPPTKDTPCVSDDALSLEHWASGAEFSIDIAQHRRVMMEEFDLLNTEAVLNLAKVYLYYGFGIEAKNILSITALDTDQTALITSIARILDVGHDPDPNPFQDATSCDGRAALWGVLSQTSLAPDTTLNERALIGAFVSLPRPLRLYLGPPLAQRLLMAGYQDLAEEVVRRVERTAFVPDDHLQMVVAKLEFSRGRVHSALETLEKIIVADGAMAPRAVVEVIEKSFEHEIDIDKKTATLAAAFAKQFIGDEGSDQYHRAHIIGLAKTGQVSAALEQYLWYVRQPKPKDHRQLLNDVTGLVTAQADDGAFLTYQAGITDKMLANLVDPVAVDSAGRMLSLGFTDMAARYLADSEASTRQRQILRGKIALVQKNHLLTLKSLQGLTGPDVDAIRAQSFLLVQDYGAAAPLFDALDRPQMAAFTAWVSGAWDRLSTSQHAVFSQPASLMIDHAGSAGTDFTERRSMTAAEYQKLLKTSSTSRHVISSLLEDTRVEAVQDK